ncbi:MAG: DUF3298 domain-containing protein [Lachnospiraceae bacterium]|nr:DUF3298 domain-containing protein [Lachnospiraceae bacterium]
MEDNRKRIDAMKREYEQKQMSREQVHALKNRMEQAKRDRKKARTRVFYRGFGAVAAAAAIFVLLPNTSAGVAHAMSNIPILGRLVEVVTFRDYQYSDPRNTADVQIPEVVVPGEEKDEKIQKTAEEINAEIQAISEQFIQEFEKNLEMDGGYQDIMVKSEVITTTEDYFTLKLICYQGAGSGMQWNYFYTIDLNTGERLALKDLFLEGSDYLGVISANIKEQMRTQMDQDENVMYWLDDEDVPEWNFQSITDETSFYVNGDGNVVINFNEGDVAPMYMGVVEFVIPDEVIKDIRKEAP